MWSRRRKNYPGWELTWKAGFEKTNARALKARGAIFVRDWGPVTYTPPGNGRKNEGICVRPPLAPTLSLFILLLFSHTLPVSLSPFLSHSSLLLFIYFSSLRLRGNIRNSISWAFLTNIFVHTKREYKYKEILIILFILEGCN